MVSLPNLGALGTNPTVIPKSSPTGNRTLSLTVKESYAIQYTIGPWWSVLVHLNMDFESRGIRHRPKKSVAPLHYTYKMVSLARE